MGGHQAEQFVLEGVLPPRGPSVLVLHPRRGWGHRGRRRWLLDPRLLAVAAVVHFQGGLAVVDAGLLRGRGARDGGGGGVNVAKGEVADGAVVVLLLLAVHEPVALHGDHHG